MALEARVLVFDFDGTMVDSFQSVVDIINRLSGRFGYTLLDESDIERFRNDASGKLFSGLGILSFLLPLAVHEVQREQAKTIEQLKTVPGLFAVIKTLSRHGFRMGIISSNAEENVRKYLRLHRSEHYFDFVHTSSLFGKDKVIDKMLDDRGLSASEVVYIGDETRDVMSAHEAGVRAVAVTWGFQTKAAFKETGADWLIDKPHELLDLLGIQPWWRRVWSRFGLRYRR